MKTILAPTDFSECAEHALKYACEVARKTKAQVVLLHVMESPENEGSFPVMGKWMGNGESDKIPFMMAMMKRTKARMKKLISSPFLKGIRTTDVIETGDVRTAVHRAAQKYKADIIIMGTHGAKGMSEVFAGSNAERVVRDAEIPVLTVQNGKNKFPINNIVFATDFSEEAMHVFPYIISFAKIFKAGIQLVRIISESNYKERMLAEKESRTFLKENGFGNFPITILHDFRSKSEGISRFAEHQGADLIALGTHGRHGLAHFLKGSIAEDVVNYSFLPVLTVNIHKKLLGVKRPVIPAAAKERERRIPYSSHTPVI